MPYRLLKDYDIAAIGSGCINREHRILLTGCAIVRHDGLLFLPQPLIHRVFLPLRKIPATGKKQAIRMIKFLDQMRCSSKQDLADKAASILVEQYQEELIITGVIPRLAVLKTARSLVGAGCGVHSVIESGHYVKKYFDTSVLPTYHRLYAFLRTAIDLTSPEELYSSLARTLLSRCTFVPMVTIHASSAGELIAKM